MSRRRKDNDLVLPPALSRLPIAVISEAISPPEEPKFYGADFAVLMSTCRKAGTLRERNAKRAGLVKGMKITGHVHENSSGPSILDAPLVILDVYHGQLKTIHEQHRLAFLLDGVDTLDEAIGILQGFSQNQITAFTEIDYFTFTYQPLFDALPDELKTRLLSIPIERAILDPAFAHLFYPTLCQTVVWHGHGILGWIEFLENFKAIDHKKAEAWRQTINTLPSAAHTDPDQPGLLQEIIDSYDPPTGPDSDYRLFVLGELDVTPIS